MAYDWIKEVHARSQAKGPAKSVLNMLAYHAADKTRSDAGETYPSVDLLAQETGFSWRTVLRALKELEQLGEISRTGEHKGRTVVYRLTLPPADQTVRETASELPERQDTASTETVRETPADCQRDSSETVRETVPIELSGELSSELESPPAVPPSLNGAHLDLGLPDPVDEMVAAWNAMAAEIGVPAVQHVTQQRRTKALARRKDLGGIAGWHDCLNKIRGSPLLRGEAKDWRATFDWVLEPRNLTKIMEGNYDDRSSGRAKDRRGGAVDDGRRRELALGAVEALGGHDGRWSASKGRA